MDPNIVVVCATVVIVALLLAVAAVGVADSYAKAHRPLTLADFVGSTRHEERGGDDR